MRTATAVWLALALAACSGGNGREMAATPPPSVMPETNPELITPPAPHAGRFSPSWIDAAAEADRAIWMGLPADRGASGHHPDAARTGAPEGDVEGLTHVTFAADGADFDPCLSRDGRFMVFASTQHRDTADIYSKSVSGRTITQLTSDPGHDLMPAISPDGGRIAFASNRAGNWDVYVMAATGGQAVQLTGGETPEVHPSWSADGKRLAFSRYGEMSGRWEMWVMDVQAPGTAEFLGYGLFPKWCPKAAAGRDGRDRILFQRSRERGDRAFGLWTIDYKPGDASSPTEVAADSAAALITADWSPEGDRIVYASMPQSGGARASGGADLWMAGIDGSSRVNLTGGRFMNLMPAWCTDGRIYFVSNRGGSTNIWSMGTERAIHAAAGPANTTPAAPATEVVNVHEEPAEPAHP